MDLVDILSFSVGFKLLESRGVSGRWPREMLFLANLGVEILRLDAAAFTWKRLGTPCESQPEAHALIRAFNALCRIAAPAMLFKSEAIVHPDEVVSYVSTQEAPLSYNPLVMALSWEALATRDATLLAQAMRPTPVSPPGMLLGQLRALS